MVYLNILQKKSKKKNEYVLLAFFSTGKQHIE